MHSGMDEKSPPNPGNSGLKACLLIAVVALVALPWWLNRPKSYNKSQLEEIALHSFASLPVSDQADVISAVVNGRLEGVRKSVDIKKDPLAFLAAYEAFFDLFDPESSAFKAFLQKSVEESPATSLVKALEEYYRRDSAIALARSSARIVQQASGQADSPLGAAKMLISRALASSKHATDPWDRLAISIETVLEIFAEDSSLIPKAAYRNKLGELYFDGSRPGILRLAERYYAATAVDQRKHIAAMEDVVLASLMLEQAFPVDPQLAAMAERRSKAIFDARKNWPGVSPRGHHGQVSEGKTADIDRLSDKLYGARDKGMSELAKLTSDAMKRTLREGRLPDGRRARYNQASDQYMDRSGHAIGPADLAKLRFSFSPSEARRIDSWQQQLLSAQPVTGFELKRMISSARLEVSIAGAGHADSVLLNRSEVERVARSAMFGLGIKADSSAEVLCRIGISCPKWNVTGDGGTLEVVVMHLSASLILPCTLVRGDRIVEATGPFRSLVVFDSVHRARSAASAETRRADAMKMIEGALHRLNFFDSADYSAPPFEKSVLSRDFVARSYRAKQVILHQPGDGFPLREHIFRAGPVRLNITHPDSGGERWVDSARRLTQYAPALDRILGKSIFNRPPDLNYSVQWRATDPGIGAAFFRALGGRSDAVYYTVLRSAVLQDHTAVFALGDRRFRMPAELWSYVSTNVHLADRIAKEFPQEVQQDALKIQQSIVR